MKASIYRCKGFDTLANTVIADTTTITYAAKQNCPFSFGAIAQKY